MVHCTLRIDQAELKASMQLSIHAEENCTLSPSMASTIKGRLQYTRSQSFGRAGGVGLQALRCYEAAGAGGPCAVLDEALRSSNLDRCSLVSRGPLWLVSRTVRWRLLMALWLSLSTFLSNKRPSFFAERVQRKKVQELAAANTRHPVFQAEVLPVAVAARTWTGQIAYRDVFWFLDNEAPGLPSSKDTRPSSRPHGW